jgi:hypothetical protein
VSDRTMVLWDLIGFRRKLGEGEVVRLRLKYWLDDVKASKVRQVLEAWVQGGTDVCLMMRYFCNNVGRSAPGILHLRYRVDIVRALEV